MSWRERAACSPHTLGNYPTTWFVPPEDLTEKQDSQWKEGNEGRRVCLTVCPVAAECLTAHYKEEYGVWGGLKPLDRKRFRRQVAFMEPSEILLMAHKELTNQRKKRK